MTQAELKQAEAVKNADETEKLRLSDHDDHEDGHEHDHALNWREISRVLFVAAAAAAIWFLGGARNPYVIGIGVICTLVGGFPIFHEAYENIVQRRMTMELSMAIAIVAALAIREVFTALVITLFVLVAEILEGLAVGRGRTAIRHLVGLLPTTAIVRRNESWQEVETKEIAAGEIVLVKLEPESLWMVSLSEAILSSIRQRSRANRCLRRRARERRSMPERSINLARSKSAWTGWGVTRHSARS
jgi:cation transport ATPase